MCSAFCSFTPILWNKHCRITQNTRDSFIIHHAETISLSPARAIFPVMQQSIETSTSSIVQQPSRLPLASFGFGDGYQKMATNGEWFGYEATFSSEGTVLSIPDRYVPDEFRDWGVAPNGFDIVSSSKVTEDTLYLKHTRALPSVGCEADAVIPEVSVLKWEGPGNGGFSDGCISCGSLQYDGSPMLTILVSGKERVQLCFRVNEQVGDVTVFRESWGSEFCDGQVLPGCGGGTRFAEGSKMNISDLLGSWEYESEEVDFSKDSNIRQTSGALSRKSLEGELVTLPIGLSVRVLQEGGSVLVESGWLHDDKRIVIERQYEEGVLTKIKKSIERRTKV